MFDTLPEILSLSTETTDFISAFIVTKFASTPFAIFVESGWNVSCCAKQLLYTHNRNINIFWN